MIVLDTTVLVYATGTAHPLRQPCRELVRLISERKVLATTTVEVIQEFAHVRSRREDREPAVALAHNYVDLLSPLVTVGEATLSRGLGIYQACDRVGAFDAVLAAAALDMGADAVVSADRAFGGVPGLVHIFPDSTGVAALRA